MIKEWWLRKRKRWSLRWKSWKTMWKLYNKLRCQCLWEIYRNFETKISVQLKRVDMKWASVMGHILKECIKVQQKTFYNDQLGKSKNLFSKFNSGQSDSFKKFCVVFICQMYLLRIYTQNFIYLRNNKWTVVC